MLVDDCKDKKSSFLKRSGNSFIAGCLGDKFSDEVDISTFGGSKYALERFFVDSHIFS